ncbi:MAG: hypothetical protein S0880_34785 [Actinomycetota bacterium]|nr:hypothetical protein [Actinomycetota bacterium]
MLVGDVADASVSADALVELLINEGAPGLERVARRAVSANSGVPEDAVRAWLGALRWGVREPTFPFGITIEGYSRPFDVLDGDLRIRTSSPTSAALQLFGRYEPPVTGTDVSEGGHLRVASIAHGIVHGLVSAASPSSPRAGCPC